MFSKRLNRRIAVSAVALAVAYAGLGVVCVRWAMANGHTPPIWPASGVALSAILLGGSFLWPVVALATLLAYELGGSTIPAIAKLVIGVGNGVAALAGAVAFRRWCGADGFSLSVRGVAALLGAATASAMLASGSGTLALVAIGALTWAGAGPAVASGFFSDLVGQLIATPLILIWGLQGPPRLGALQLAHLSFALVAASATAAFVFLSPPAIPNAWLVLPFMIWPAVSFHHHGATAAILVVSTFAVVGSLSGLGPFGRITGGGSDQLALLQEYLAVASVVGLIVAAAFDERRAREALAESEARFRAAVDAFAGILWTNDPQGRMAGDQPGWATLTGQSKDQYQGYGWSTAVHPDDAQPTIAAWNEAVARRSVFAFEHRVRRADGQWRLFSIRAIPVLDRTGQVREWVGVHTDVTDERAAVAALRERERQQACVADLGRLALAATHQREVMDQAVAAVTKGLGSEFASLLELDPDQRSFTARAARGFRPEYRVDEARLPAGPESQAGYALHSGAPVIVENLLDETRFGAAFLRSHDILSGMSVPIAGAKNRSWGVLGVHSSRQRSYAEHDVRFLEAIANIVADTIRVDQQRQALVGSEARLQAIVNTAVDGIIVIDEAGLMQSVNPAAIAMFGYSADELVGRNVKLLMHEPHRRAHDDYIDNYKRTGERKIIGIGREVEGRRKDGSSFLLELAIAEWQDASERRHFTGIIRDITRRKAIEAGLRASEERFRSLAQSMPALVLATSADGSVAYTNPQFRRFSGLSEDDLRRSGWTQVVHPDDRPKITLTSPDGISGEAECRLCRHDGVYRTHLVSWRHVHDLEPETVQTITACTDVEELVNARRALASANVELEKAVAAALTQREAALAQVHEMQKLETIGQLTGGVAHDFNNLLSATMASLELLRKRVAPDDERAGRHLQIALQATERGAALTRRLLAFARRQHLEPEALVVEDLVRGMHELISRSVGPLIDVRLVFASQLARVRVDRNQLEMALLNLCLNARDAMPSGGVLEIAANDSCGGQPAGLPSGQYVRVSVTDTGVGMPADIVRRAVEPFFTTKGVGKGTGLGLSMVHGLTAQSGGTMIIDSAPGQGTTVSLWLPAAPEPVESRQARPIAAEAQHGQGTILLVDDDQLVLAATAAMLEDLGYDVVTAESVRAALDMIRGGCQPDLIITDYAMPVRTGAELAKAVRAEWPQVPVILVSGYAELRDDEGREMTVLFKPFSRHDLSAAVVDALSASGAHCGSGTMTR